MASSTASMFSFLKNNHYLWDTGLAGHLSWAPLGTKIKKRLEDYLRRQFVLSEFEEIETSLIYRQEVWEKSGHWSRFQDPIIRTTQGRSFRVDKLLEEHYPDMDYSSLTLSEIQAHLREINLKWIGENNKPEPGSELHSEPEPEPESPGPDLLEIGTELEYQSLMMQLDSGSQRAGLRPETATATYFHYQDLVNAMCHQFPLKVFQIGRSFRNEISPKHNLIRGREFTQAEFQVILPEEMKGSEEVANTLGYNYLAQTITLWDPSISASKRVSITEIASGNPVFQCLIAMTFSLFECLGFAPDKLRLRRHGSDEMAFYALDAYDIEINLRDLGWTEIAGLHDRGAWDLRHLNEKDPEAMVPNVLEVAIGVDRLVYAILDRLYEEKGVSEGKTTLRLPYYLAPIQVSVLPLLKNRPSIIAKAREVYRMLKSSSHFTVEYADKKSIGKRYLENARRGIPWSITIDYETLDNETVTLRDRDTEAQIRVPIKELRNVLLERLYADTD